MINLNALVLEKSLQPCNCGCLRPFRTEASGLGRPSPSKPQLAASRRSVASSTSKWVCAILTLSSITKAFITNSSELAIAFLCDWMLSLSMCSCWRYQLHSCNAGALTLLSRTRECRSPWGLWREIPPQRAKHSRCPITLNLNSTSQILGFWGFGGKKNYWWKSSFGLRFWKWW